MYDKAGCVLFGFKPPSITRGASSCAAAPPTRAAAARDGCRCAKDVIDLPRRVELSRAANARYLDALAVVHAPTVSSPPVGSRQSPRDAGRFVATAPSVRSQPDDAAMEAACLAVSPRPTGFRHQDLLRVLATLEAPRLPRSHHPPAAAVSRTCPRRTHPPGTHRYHVTAQGHLGHGHRAARADTCETHPHRRMKTLPARQHLRTEHHGAILVWLGVLGVLSSEKLLIRHRRSRTDSGHGPWPNEWLRRGHQDQHDAEGAERSWRRSAGPAPRKVAHQARTPSHRPADRQPRADVVGVEHRRHRGHDQVAEDEEHAGDRRPTRSPRIRRTRRRGSPRAGRSDRTPRHARVHRDGEELLPEDVVEQADDAVEQRPSSRRRATTRRGCCRPACP